MDGEPELAGEKTTCPTCQREFIVVAEEARTSFVWRVLIVVGGLTAAYARFGGQGIEPEPRAAVRMAGAALFGLGIGGWTHREWEAVLESGFLLMVLGFGAVGARLVMDWQAGLIASGFVAVAGAVLTVKNKVLTLYPYRV